MTPDERGASDEHFMQHALRLAARGWGRVSPNPLVGAVLVRDGQVVGEGYHAEFGRPHAEAEALRDAGERACGATLYVTLEPCNHQGKTPPCTETIVRAGVSKVVYAAADPNPRAGGGADRLRSHGIEVVGGVRADGARELNAPFFFSHTPAGAERPWIALKLALSLDARISDSHGDSAWITGEAARAEVHRLRAGFDALAVGIGTALSDDPRLTVRGSVVPRQGLIRLVFDRLLRLPPDGYLARTAHEVPLWIVCSPDAPTPARKRLEALGVSVITAKNLAEALRHLRSRAVESLLCEGGAQLAGSILRSGQVDRLYLFYAPLFLGRGAHAAFGELPDVDIATAARWRHLESRSFGPDTLVMLAR